VTGALFKIFASLAFRELQELAFIPIAPFEISGDEGQFGVQAKIEQLDSEMSVSGFMLRLVAPSDSERMR